MFLMAQVPGDRATDSVASGTISTLNSVCRFGWVHCASSNPRSSGSCWAIGTNVGTNGFWYLTKSPNRCLIIRLTGAFDTKPSFVCVCVWVCLLYFTALLWSPGFWYFREGCETRYRLENWDEPISLRDRWMIQGRNQNSIYSNGRA
jgi:hypothetical protein